MVRHISHNSKMEGDLTELLKLSNVFLKNKLFSKAQLVLQRAAALYPHDFRVLFNLGQIFVERGMLHEALLNIQNAMCINESNIECHELLSGIHLKMKNPSKTVVISASGLVMHSGSIVCWFNLNVALRQLNKLVLACRLCICSIKLYPIFQLTMKNVYHKKIDFVCVKWGKKYSSLYVNALYQGLIKNFGSFRLLCFADDASGIDANVITLPFDMKLMNFNGWWLKANVFNTSSYDGLEGIEWLVYLDLDTIIAGDVRWLTELALSDNKDIFFLDASEFQNEARPAGINSSMIVWRAGEFQCVFDVLVSEHERLFSVIYKFDHYLELLLYRSLPKIDCEYSSSAVFSTADESQQEVVLECTQAMQRLLEEVTDDAQPVDDSGIQQCSCGFIQDCFPGRIADYHAAQDELTSRGSLTSSIICFPLQPKPHQLPEDSALYRLWTEGAIS